MTNAPILSEQNVQAPGRFDVSKDQAAPFEITDAHRTEISESMGACAIYAGLVQSYLELRDDAGAAYALMRHRECALSALRHFKALMGVQGASIGGQT